MVSGSVHPAFQGAVRAFERQIPQRSGGAALCIYHRGRKVVDCWAGTRDAQGTPWQEDTLALSYSTSKGVVSTLLHMLVDRGLLDYDDPVARYWPEFAQSHKGDITVRHVLCHEAGLYDIRSIVDHGRRILEWDYMVEALADAVPRHAPGETHGYHGLTYGWLVGELIQRVTGKPFREVLEAELARPLDLDGLYIGLPADQRHRKARSLRSLKPPPVVDGRRRGLGAVNRWSRRANGVLRRVGAPLDLRAFGDALLPRGIGEVDFDSESVDRVSIPAANGVFTARSLAKLYAVLAAGGELEGVRLMRRETLWRATRVQNHGVDRVIPIPMQWRLGYHRVPTFGPPMRRAFGHSGFGGSGAWADPDRELAVALTLNSGVGMPFGDLRIVRISTAAVRCAERRRSDD